MDTAPTAEWRAIRITLAQALDLLRDEATSEADLVAIEKATAFVIRATDPSTGGLALHLQEAQARIAELEAAQKKVDASASVADMPSVEDLRQIARQAFEVFRGDRPEGPRHYQLDLQFAFGELQRLGRADVYEAEHRRSELIRRGFTPSDDGQDRGHG